MKDGMKDGMKDTPENERQVSVQLSAIDKTIAVIEEDMLSLRTRLQSVLKVTDTSPAYEKAEAKAEVETALVPLAEHIRGQSWALKEMDMDIKSMLNALQL